jgi:hypothetical protein
MDLRHSTADLDFPVSAQGLGRNSSPTSVKFQKIEITPCFANGQNLTLDIWAGMLPKGGVAMSRGDLRLRLAYVDIRHRTIFWLREGMADELDKTARPSPGPTRGTLRLLISASSAQVVAGSDFSIFVNIQNPYDVPITIYKVDTHIPIELIDINWRRLEKMRRERTKQSASTKQSTSWQKKLLDWITGWSYKRVRYSGIAIAVGTDFDPTQEKSFVEMATTIQTLSGENVTITGLQLNFSD